MSGLQLDFVLYLGDPDDGAEAIASRNVLETAESHKEKLKFPDVYGAIKVTDDSGEIAELKPDPILSLLTNFTKALPYVIEGESETVLLSESENGFAFEPSGDDVFFSFFAGDAYEPDDYFVEQTSVKLDDFGENVLSMAERLRDLIKKLDPDFLENDEYSQGFVEFIDMGRKAFKTFQLEVERGLRVT